MALLTTSTGVPIGFINLDLVAGETSPPMEIFATASAGATLQSGTSTAFELRARRHGTADPFVALDTGIDLSGDPPGPVDFDLEAVGGSVSGLVRDAVSIGVTSSSAAGWDD
jgi:hypothetical protein